MTIKYDRAREEETILNKLYPDYDFDPVKSVEEQKDDALILEIYEVGGVSRCCFCGSVESIDDKGQAKQFAWSTKLSIYLFVAISIVISSL